MKTITNYDTLKLWSEFFDISNILLILVYFMDMLIVLILWVLMIVIGMEIWIIERGTTSFVFYIGDTTFTWSSKKQSIVILSTCEVEYIAIASCVCHSMWLKKLLKKKWMSQEKPTKIYVDNSSVIVLAKNPVFHYWSKHIDTRFHYLRDCIINKEVKAKYVKTQD
jgi:hypothetical protein